jgi:hypothetical protein
MDWYIIEYLYPKSFNVFIETMFPNIGMVSISTLKNFDIKKLYSFFDKQGIYLILEINHLNLWNFVIKKDNWVLSDGTFTARTREEIEEEGFMHCFKKLEENINYKQKV